MAGILHELDSRESLLLMYLAGELPADERAEVDRRLAADSDLRAEFDRLAALEQQAGQWMEQLRTASPATGDDRALRQVMREIRRWHVQRPAPATEQPARRRMPVWGYPMSAAAAVIIGLGLWGIGVFDSPPNPGTGGGPTVAVRLNNEQILAELTRSLETPSRGAFDDMDRHVEALESAEEARVWFPAM